MHMHDHMFALSSQILTLLVFHFVCTLSDGSAT